MSEVLSVVSESQKRWSRRGFPVSTHGSAKKPEASVLPPSTDDIPEKPLVSPDNFGFSPPPGRSLEEPLHNFPENCVLIKNQRADL